MSKPRRITPHYVALVVEDSSGVSGIGPTRASVQRRLKRQAAALAVYSYATAHRPPQAEPAYPLTANTKTCAKHFITKFESLLVK